MKKTKKRPDTLKVMRLGNSFPSNSLEELALKTKSVTMLTFNLGVDTCKLCKAKSNCEWQITEFDDSWGFLCGPCGLKLSEN